MTLLGRPTSKLLAAVLAASSIVTSCNYSSNDIVLPTSTNPSGFYTGTRVSAVSGTAVDVVALASESGEFRIFDPASHEQFVAGLSFADDTLQDPLKAYAAPGTVFPDKSGACTGTVSGSVQPGMSITGSYACGGDHGTFSLLYDVTASLQSAGGRFPPVGTRGGIGPGDSLFLATQSNGAIAGSDSAGCSYAGQLSAIDPFINVYTVTLGQTCGKQLRVLTGLATFGFIQNSATQALYVAVSGGNNSIAAALPYQ